MSDRPVICFCKHQNRQQCLIRWPTLAHPLKHNDPQNYHLWNFVGVLHTTGGMPSAGRDGGNRASNIIGSRSWRQACTIAPIHSHTRCSHAAVQSMMSQWSEKCKPIQKKTVALQQSSKNGTLMHNSQKLKIQLPHWHVCKAAGKRLPQSVPTTEMARSIHYTLSHVEAV